MSLRTILFTVTFLTQDVFIWYVFYLFFFRSFEDTNLRSAIEVSMPYDAADTTKASCQFFSFLIHRPCLHVRKPNKTLNPARKCIAFPVFFFFELLFIVTS